MSSTSAYSDSTGAEIEYSPIFTTMYKEGLTAPLFSLAILRDVSGPAGYLTLGGLPPVSYNAHFATTPILVTSIQNYPKTYDFYTINIDGLTVKDRTLPGSGGSIQYIVRLLHVALPYPVSLIGKFHLLLTSYSHRWIPVRL